MIKKLFLLLLPILMTLMFSGCGNNSFIIMKSVPLTQQNAVDYEQNFEKYQRIYYAVVNPQGFKDDAIKIEIIKKSDKTDTYGLSMQYAQDLPIDNSKNYYTNYFTVSTAGLYFMQVLELRRPDKCLARYWFRVK